MTIPSFEAAYKICELSNWSMTNLKLQKLLYLSHLLYLGEKKKNLVDEDFEAWNFGPVLPSLYDKVKIFGDRPIQNIFFNTRKNESLSEIIFLKEKYKELSHKSAWELVLMTHLKEGAWEKYYSKDEKNIKIPNAAILEEYNKFYEQKTTKRKQ